MPSLEESLCQCPPGIHLPENHSVEPLRKKVWDLRVELLGEDVVRRNWRPCGCLTTLPCERQLLNHLANKEVRIAELHGKIKHLQEEIAWREHIRQASRTPPPA